MAENPLKIEHKIVGYSVRSKAEAPPVPGKADVIQMHETLERPEKLVGTTYKLKVPDHVSEHAMYITINDIVLNEGTEFELRRPFEVFINSKNLDHYQWIVALTRIMSAVFRKGGDVTFLVEELRSVFDPRGGYWNKGKYMPSIIAEIGDVIEQHLVDIGLLRRNEPDENQLALIAAKKAELEGDSGAPIDAWRAQASMCSKCHQKGVIIKDGCQTCLDCGDSKCG